MRLCEAAFGSLYTYDGERFHSAAQRGVPPAYAAFREQNPPNPAPDNRFAQAIETRRTLQILDLKAEKPYLDGNPNSRAMVELGGIRTILSVPLCKDDTLLGIIAVFRQDVRAFSGKQIELLENFAAQAVIAMENARLLRELQQRTGDLQDSLDYQTATSEVLKVISGSGFELEPVFRTVAATAARLCHADEAGIYLDRGGEYRQRVDQHDHGGNTQQNRGYPTGCCQQKILYRMKAHRRRDIDIRIGVMQGVVSATETASRARSDVPRRSESRAIGTPPRSSPID